MIHICLKETTQHEFIQLHRINKQPYKFYISTYAQYDRTEQKEEEKKIHLLPTLSIDKERILSALLNCQWFAFAICQKIEEKNLLERKLI